MPTTRWLYASDLQLASLRDAGCYVFAPDGTITPWTGAPTGDTFNFYEVAQIATDPAGSWWLPTAPQSQVPPAWLNAPGGVIALAATGGIWTVVTRGGQVEPVQRPDMLLWWVPRDSLSQLTEFPGSVAGAVTGAFPSSGPPASQPPPQPQPCPAPGIDGEGPDDWVRRIGYNQGMRRAAARPAPRADVVRAYRDRVRAQLGASPVRPPGANWIPIGPSVGLQGQGAAQPDVSGRITAIAVAPGGERLYVAAANGGVWRSDDGGDSFVPTMDGVDIRPTGTFADALSVGALALHPGRPDRVFVGTGEAPGGEFHPQREGSLYFGVGMLMTDDGGRSWSREKMTPPAPAAFGSSFYMMASDPFDPERVLAASPDGVYRREPRNADQFPGQVSPPTAYFIQYDPGNRAAYAHYWSADGLTAPRAPWGGAAALPELNATLLTMMVDGEPWLLSYAAGNGNFNLYRIGGDSVPVQIASGTWATNLTVMMVVLAGEPYAVLAAANGQTMLKRLGAVPVDAWAAAKAWPAAITAMVPLVLDGQPAFLRYQGGAGTCELMVWGSDLDVTQVWTDGWDANLGLAAVTLRGRPGFLRWKNDGSLALYGFAPDLRPRRAWSEPADTWARGCTFIPFPFDDEQRFLAYRANDGWTSLNTLGPSANLRQRNAWIQTWDANQVIVPFSIGYGWQQRLAIHCTGVAIGDDGDVAIAWAAANDGDTYSSTDRGRTWHRARQALPPNSGRIALAMQPTNPYVVYASTQTGLVFRNDGGGAPFLWRQIYGIPADYVRTQGNYDLALVVAPDDPDRIYIGGCWIESPQPGVPGSDLYVGAIYRCDIDATGGTPQAQTRFIGNSTHADVHTFAFRPDAPHDLWVGCDGGLFVCRRPTDVRDLDVFEAKNTGLVTMTMNHLGQHPTEDAVLFCGTQDNGNVRFVSDEAWLHWAPGDSGYVVVNRTTPANVLSTYTEGGLMASTNGGERNPANFTFTQIGLLQGEPVMFYAPLVGTTATTPTLTANTVAFGSSRPWISTDFGVTWRSIPANNNTDFLTWPPTQNDRITAMAFSPSAARLYLGTQDGRVFRYDYNAGTATWGAKQNLTAVGGGPLPTTAVTGFAFDAANAGALWVSFGGTIGNANHVWYLNVANTNWAARGGAGATALLDIHYNCIVADPANAGTIYVGGDLGVWRSADSGGTWTAFAQNLPESAVIDLALFPADAGRQAPALLRAATFGRGVWERVLDNTAKYHRGVQLYIRKTYLDRGLYPAVDGVASPINPLVPVNVNHRYSPDVKFVQPDNAGVWPSPSAIDFTQFAKLAPTGNEFPTLDRNRKARVYVQVHNRGIVPARDVKVTIALSTLMQAPPNPPPPITGFPGPPALPGSYWDDVNEGTPLTSASWRPVATVTISEVRVGVPMVVSGEIPVAFINALGVYTLVAFASCKDDRYTSHQLSLDAVSTAEPQAAIRYVVTV